jgi:hypothetical protein
MSTKTRELTGSTMAEPTVITYPGEDGWIVAECLEIPECLSQAKTREEALQRVVEDQILPHRLPAVCPGGPGFASVKPHVLHKPGRSFLQTHPEEQNGTGIFVEGGLGCPR